LISAIERDEFEVYYQPQIVAVSGRMIGVEALLRWHNPKLGLVYPGTFIPLAEHTGLIREIGTWVLGTACQQVQQWNETGLDPTQLELEITESAVMQNLEEAKVVMRSLKELGIKLAIDDFGTGYSSLSNLQHFPLDRSKHDV
jgi:EAL domain-containing protein (putative c-di-GMP-specific phosphodiesterase class I)